MVAPMSGQGQSRYFAYVTVTSGLHLPDMSLRRNN